MAALIALCAGLASLWILQARGGVRDFYESQFGPAVSFACSGRYEEVLRNTPDLDEMGRFLAHQRDALPCSELPADLAPHWTKTNFFQDASLYLIGAAALIWRVAGVSWSSLNGLTAVLAGIFAASVYGFSRLFIGRMLSAVVTLAAFTSPFHLAMLPLLRDYSKAPFILAALFLSGLALSGRTAALRFGAAAAAGAVTGIGLGFRSDSLLVVPFFVLLVGVACLLDRGFRPRQAAGVLVIMLLCFGAASLPILMSYDQGGWMGHIGLLGLMTHFNGALYLSHSSYDLGHLYRDYLVNRVVITDHLMHGGEPGAALPYNRVYNSHATHLYIRYCLTFSADMLVRVYSAILQVLNLRLSELPGSNAPPDANPLRAAISTSGIGPALAGIAAALLANARPKAAAIFILALLYFAGSAAIQFFARHAFYLEFFFWLSCGIVLAALARWLARPGLPSFAQLLGPWLAVPGLLALMVMALFGARAYQDARLPALVARYIQAEPIPVATEKVAEGEIVRFVPSGPVPDVAGATSTYGEGRGARSYYFVAQLDLSRCARGVVRLTVRYEPANGPGDFGRYVFVRPNPSGQARVFFPASATPLSHFAGLEFEPGKADCFAGLGAFTRESGLPMPLWLVAGADGAIDHSHQSMVDR